MLVSELKKLKLQSEILTVQRHCVDDDLTGVVEFVNREVTVLCLYSDDGDFEGYSLFFTEQIEEVMWGNREHKAIARLVKEYGDKQPFRATGDSFNTILDELIKHYSSLCIYTHDESTFDLATVEEISGEWMKIQTFGPRKSLSRLYKLIRFEDIARIDVDSSYQNKIVELHNETT